MRRQGKQPGMTCDIHYEKDPQDYQISKSDLNQIFYSRNVDQFNINIAGDEYNFIKMATVEQGTQYAFSCPPEKQEQGFLLKSLFQGDVITVEVQNATFLKEAARALNLDELGNIADKYIAHGYMEQSIASFLMNVVKWLCSLMCHMSYLYKVLQTLWDLMGPIIIIGFYLNSIVLLSTMMLYILQKSAVFFIFVLLPCALYSYFFVNIICICVEEFFKFNAFSDSPWKTVQILFMKFIKNTRLGANLKKEYLQCKLIKDIIMGVLCIIFLLSLACLVVNANVTKLIEVYVLIFAVILPPVKYFLIILLYALHGFESCFLYCRIRYREFNDFTNSFLNSIYFRDHPYQSLGPVLFNIRAEEDPTTRRLNNRRNVPQNNQIRKANRIQESDTDDNMDSHEIAKFEEISDNLTSDERQSAQQTACSTLKNAVFSRNTCTVYVILALLSYLISEYMNSTFSYKQALCMVFIFMLVTFPVCTWMPMPFFWIHRQKDQVLTERMLQIEYESLKSTREYKKYGNDLLIWSKKNLLIRWTSVFTTGLLIVLFILFSIVGIIFLFRPFYLEYEYVTNHQYAVLTNQTTSTNTTDTNSTNTTSIDTNSTTITPNISDLVPLPENSTSEAGITRSPICTAKSKGLSYLQLMSLANAPYMDGVNRSSQRNVLFETYFGSEYNSSIILYDSYYNKTYKTLVYQYKISTQQGLLTVFAIKGDTHMNDILAGIELWFSTMVYNAASPIIPFLKVFSKMSRKVINFFLSMPRLIFRQFSVSDTFIQSISDYITNQTIAENETVIIVGHSFGGAAAKVISMKTGYTAFSISSPDVKAVEHFYNDKSDVRYTWINIEPEMDVVSMFEPTVSQSIQKVPCNSGLFKCHSLPRTLCQTGIICGDEEKYRDYCKLLFHGKNYTRMLNYDLPIVYK